MLPGVLPIGIPDRSYDRAGELIDAWAEAVELGRWPSQVPPYTRNRRHTLSQIC
jgi:hypothetical protein